MQQRVSLGNSNQAIVITHQEFDEDGFAIGQKTGLLPIDASKDGEEMLQKAANYHWTLKGNKNTSGFVTDVTRGRKLTEAEMKTLQQVGRSYIVELKNDKEVAAESKEVIQEGEVGTPTQIGRGLRNS